MDLEQKAIKRIQDASEMSLFHYGKPLVCTYSGGKDSDVMLELFRRGGIKAMKLCRKQYASNEYNLSALKGVAKDIVGLPVNMAGMLKEEICKKIIYKFPADEEV